jgi:hypothetical protein
MRKLFRRFLRWLVRRSPFYGYPHDIPSTRTEPDEWKPVRRSIDWDDEER